MGTDPTVGLQSVKVQVNRSITIGGRQYAPGEPFDTTGMHPRKIGQLLQQRILRPAPEPEFEPAEAVAAEPAPTPRPVVEPAAAEPEPDPGVEPESEEN